jgi:hypothetical protein
LVRTLATWATASAHVISAIAIISFRENAFD